ncbi:MAG: asparagine--tRNA ligase [Planctomycetes bacterium]|nr:asparagine--tRNA ligase [Planctomycetota bacterium]
MQLASISKLENFVDQEVTLRGWLYNRRGKGKLLFLILRDGTGHVQCVCFRPDMDPELFARLEKLTYESSIQVTGVVKKDERSQGGFEIGVKDVKVVSEAEENYPIAIQEDTPNIDHLLDNRHLWIRSKIPHATLRIRNEVVQAIRDFFYEREFILVDSPIFTPNACEGTTNLFEVDYFDEKAYLTQSGQLYNEATCMAHGKTYCFGPTFRAEKSKTRRHLTEFWMVEPEMAYAGLDDVMDLCEDFLSYVVERCLTRARKWLDILGRDVTKLENVTKPFPRISYADACAKIIEKRAQLLASGSDDEKRIAKDAMTEPGDDFGAADETIIGMIFDKPTMVHRYPKSIKAFYMKADPQQPEYALCVDVIGPEGAGELIGGGEREDSLDNLLAAIKHHKLPEEAFKWYLDLRRYGSVPHAGFGLGVERTVGWICGNPHVRETIPFPRLLHRLSP